MKIFPKKYMFSILKLKKAKNSYGGNPTDFFSRYRQKLQPAPQLLENIQEFTKENKIKSKLIKQHFNKEKKYQNIPKYTKIIPAYPTKIYKEKQKKYETIPGIFLV
jgi:hypothetical protein